MSFKKADKILRHFSPQNAYNYHKLCADEKDVSSSLILNLLVPEETALAILWNFGEIHENSSSKKFATVYS